MYLEPVENDKSFTPEARVSGCCHMSKIPSLNYHAVIDALEQDGWVVARQRGSYIRPHKHTGDEVLELTVPAYKLAKLSTLSHTLKQAHLG